MVRIATFIAAALLVAPVVIAVPNPAGPMAQEEDLVVRALLNLYGRQLENAGEIVTRDLVLDERSFGSFMKKVGKTAFSILKREEDMDLYQRDFDELDERSFKSVMGKIGGVVSSILKREDGMDLSERDLDELDERSFGSIMKKIGKTALSILKREEDMDMYERDYDELDELD